MALTRVKKVPTANLVQGSSFLTSVATSDMPAGSIIQIQHVKTNTKTTTSSGTMGDATNLTLSFTPLLASSTLKITAHCATKQQKTSSNYAGGSFTILHNGSILDANPDSYEQFTQAHGGSVTEINNYLRSSKVAFVSASNTSARTIKIQLKSYGSSDFSINWTTSFYSYLIVEEIKG
tara:strand:+ start:255 stop:788 length:534 start_codon:yes stop_codon:yes gene_type:complete